MMTLPIQTLFVNTIEQHGLLSADTSVVVGVSGGADSICLLHLLASHYPGLTAGCVYIDHLLRPGETEAEKRLVHKLCNKLGLEFGCLEIDVEAEARKSGESQEACARTLRYRAFEQFRIDAGAEFVAVGHTRDDQVEEVLIRLIRGSGLKGLSGMDYRNGRVIRPLLDVAKSEVLKYLDRYRLGHCEDSSNRSRRFLRNRVRLDLLPLLEREFNPAIRDNMTRMATIFKAEDAYLQEHMRRAFDRVVAGYESGAIPSSPVRLRLQIAPFIALHRALQRRVLEELCWKMVCRPDSTMIDNIIEFATRAENGSEMHLPGGVRLIKEADDLLFSLLEAGQSKREKFAAPIPVRMEIAAPGTYRIAQLQATLQLTVSEEPPDPTEAAEKTMILDAERVVFPLALRTPEPGERFRPLNGPGSKKISRYLSDKKIPAHLRRFYPVLSSQQGEPDIVCIVGLAIAEGCKIRPDTRRFLIVRWLKEQID